MQDYLVGCEWSYFEGGSRPRLKDASLVAKAISEGYTVDYEPGDGTRYECCIVVKVASHGTGIRYLLISNLDAFFNLNKFWNHSIYCSNKTSPVGSWYALRPLFSALGCGPGESTLNQYDRYQETNTRRSIDAEPLNQADARLGRLVRRAIENE